MKTSNVTLKGEQPTSAYSFQSTSDFWLQHCHLGHPSISSMQSMFPTFLRNLDVSNLHCDVCEFSKHHRVSYPVNNKLSSIPFTLIHLDVWGPSRIPNCFGARWFITFIDNCNRMTWVYLLKNNAAISSILPIFYKMISN